MLVRLTVLWCVVSLYLVTLYRGVSCPVTAPSTVDGRPSFQLFAMKNSTGVKILVHDFSWAFLLVEYLEF